MLASRATAGNRNARAAFLQLPSQLRQLSHQQSSRSFSASAPRNIQLIDVATAPPLAILNGLHGIGIPWYAAIPTAAILIRGVFGYYFSAKPARKREQIRSNLAPLLSADVLLSLKNDHPNRRSRDIPPLFHITKRMTRMHQVGKVFGAPAISWSTPLNFGTLLAMTETVRMKCGAREGLLSTILTPFEWLVAKANPNSSSPVFDREARAQALAERMEQVREMRLQQAKEQTLGADGQALSEQSTMSENLFNASELPAPPRINVDSMYFDPSLQTEGLSWCTDLVACDPYQVLPLATAAVMISNILLNPSPIPRPYAGAQKLPPPIRFLVTRYSPWQGFFMAVACGFGYILQEMPAAIVLYIFSATVTGFVQRRWLELNMPLRKPIMPCRRGTRVRSKKEWSARA
jgi:inner membrane protein COX18